MKYRNILIIDDDEEDLEIFMIALEQVNARINCETCKSAGHALEKLDNGEINADLIFLDLNMPKMSGQDFLMKIKEKNHLEHIPVIILSTSSQPTTIQKTKELGAVDFITKPSGFEKLVNIIETILN